MVRAAGKGTTRGGAPIAPRKTPAALARTSPAAVVAAWPGLPESIKSGIVAMVTAVVGRWWRPSFRTAALRASVSSDRRALPSWLY
jgi:hypothetical protein